MKSNKIFIVIVLATVGTAFFLFLTLHSGGELSEPAATPRASADLLYAKHAPTFGADGAQVKLVEFLDPECEACRAMYPIVKNLISEYPGRIQLIVRYMPLHKNSKLAAFSLEAAREQGKYWEALDLLFERQPEWADHHEPRPELIRIILNELGLDMKFFDQSISGRSLDWKVDKDQEDGKSLGVQRTPTFFVNGRQLHEIGYDPIRKAIEEELKK